MNKLRVYGTGHVILNNMVADSLHSPAKSGKPECEIERRVQKESQVCGYFSPPLQL